MKNLIFFLIFLGVSLCSFSQDEIPSVCRFGFTFEVSRQASWGDGKPVILSITPLSPADAAGLKINDVIESINGATTQGQMSETIVDWLQNSDAKIQLVVSNLKESNKEVSLLKECQLNNSLNERDLAPVYSFYSLEDVQSRSFTCPFKTTINMDVQLKNYKTFGFVAIDENNRKLEEIINKEIKESLEHRGLVYADNQPDLIVHTYYSYNKNPNYHASANTEKFPIECRYNMHTKAMENLPIYYNPLIHTNQAEFFLKLGIRLIDRKKSSDDNLFTVWECEANELLQSNYSLDKYSQFHIPLMVMQYPYPKSFERAEFYYSRFRYNYTGIGYNVNDLKEIADIDLSSPAYEAGLRPGDVVEKINGIKFNHNLRNIDNDYKQFILKTMHLRDSKTQFTNAEGFTRCMYWDIMKYAQIAEEFKKPEFSTVFSYLFYFEPYINLSGTNIVTFNISRGKQKQEIRIKPLIITGEMFENR